MTAEIAGSWWLRWSLTVASALLFAAAFPPWMTYGAIPAFASVAMLLLALRGADAPRARAMGFVWGMVAYGVSLSWLWMLFHLLAVGLWAMLAVFIACFAWMQSLAEKKGVTGWRWLVFTMINWGGWEFIRAELFPLKFPWMTPGVACGPNWLLPWVGVYGVSALMVLLAAWAVGQRTWVRKGAVFVVALCAVADLGMGWRGWSPLMIDESRAVKTALVQNESVSMDQFVLQTEKLATGVRLIVWPEYTLPYDVKANRRDMMILQKLCSGRNAVMVVGTQTTPAGQKNWFNTALTLGAGGVLGEHAKVHPVHFFEDGTPGTTALPVKTPLGVLGTPICFDCDYEDVVRGMTVAGAEFFAAPTMDAVSWSARQHLQHAALFRIRACENGRWIAVCASSGVSQIINSRGEVQESLPPMAVGEVSGVLIRETGLTFFTQYGWFFPWINLGAAVICWVALWVSRGRRKEAGI